jgi:hypothetical protein
MRVLKDNIQRLQDRRNFRDALEKLLATDHGKLFFRRFLRDCNVVNPKFSMDPMKTAYNEGKRHLAMSYLSVLSQDDPQALIDRMRVEQQDNQE